MGDNFDRRDFLKVSSASLAGMAMAGYDLAGQALAQTGKAVKLAFVGIGGRGSYHLDCALGMEGVDVVAVCDIDDGALYKAKRWVEESGRPSPRTYGESRTAYQTLCEKEQVDCVICCTPWEFHTPCALAAMKNGKHCVSEVPIVITVEEAWQLVEMFEKTGKWATIGLEGFGDLTLMNMVRKGLFGDVLHLEGGYVHDLRMVKFNPLEEPWRLMHALNRNGNLYPDHPMARIMRLADINHGDRFDYLVSMSSKGVMLQRYAALKFGEQHPFAQKKFAEGDVNVTLLHTEQGKVVTLNHDTNTPHPREFFRMQGTKGVYQTGASLPPAPAPGQPPANPQEGFRRGRGGMIYIEGRTATEHMWESAEKYFEEYMHPFMKEYKPVQRKVALRGHGGGSAVTPVNWDRLIAALRTNRQPDFDVYDSVTSSVISPLTEKSVGGGSVPVQFPDFTKGKYKTAKPFDVAPIPIA